MLLTGAGRECTRERGGAREGETANGAHHSLSLSPLPLSSLLDDRWHRSPRKRRKFRHPTRLSPNSHSSSLLFSDSSPQRSTKTLGLEPFEAGKEEERQTRFEKRREEGKEKREKKTRKTLFSSRQSKAIEQREQQKQSTRTGPLPGQAAPERDVGQHAGEGRREGHERGCVERHIESERQWEF